MIKRGAWITLPHFSILEVLSLNNFDFFVLDMQHSALTLSDIDSFLSLSIEKPIYVRPESNASLSIGRILDLGADGIILPNVDTVEDMEDCIKQMNYGMCRSSGLCRAQLYGKEFERYHKEKCKKLKLYVQIESARGVNNIKDIVNDKYVDGIIVGPYDLSNSLGDSGNFNSIRFKNCIEKVKIETLKANKDLGYHIVFPTLTKINEKIEEGFNFLIIGTDWVFLRHSERFLKE